MDSKMEDDRRSKEAWRLTPRERLDRFVELQRRAMELLAASPEGYRRYWERNIRKARNPCSSSNNPLNIFQLLVTRLPVLRFVVIRRARLLLRRYNFHGYVQNYPEDFDVIFERTEASEAALLNPILESIHACWISV